MNDENGLPANVREFLAKYVPESAQAAFIREYQATDNMLQREAFLQLMKEEPTREEIAEALQFHKNLDRNHAN